jgi:hypothetical protein
MAPTQFLGKIGVNGHKTLIFFNMNGSSLHLDKKYDLYKIHYHLNLLPEWRLDPFTLKNQCLLAILQLFFIETS